MSAKPLLPAWRQYALPVADRFDEDRKFRRVLTKVTAAIAVLSLVIPFLPVTRIDPVALLPDSPDRVAKLLIERRIKPPPPKPAPPEPKVEKPDAPKAVVPKPEPKPRIKPVAQPKPEPKVEKVPDREAARTRAANAGVLAVADELAALRDNVSLDSLEKNTVQGSGAKAERRMITSSSTSGSGGISTSNLSRATGGTGLTGRATTEVVSPVPASAGGGSGNGASAARASSLRSRSREEIELIFDKNKSAIYAIYNRALRNDPALEGKLVVRLTIDPSGRVSACEVVSSELASPELESRLVRRIRMFDFGAKDVEAMTTVKPIDFFPG